MQRPNPFVGPSPLERGQPLYGRDHELAELRNLLIAERIILLYSPSGAGKTSLIRAGLVETLGQEGFHVLPVISLSQPPGSNGTNRYIQSAIRSLDEGVGGAARANLAAPSLHDYLNARPRAPDAPDIDLLIFDQFEQILTLDPTDVPAKTEFFAQVAEALQAGDRWALFSLREDHLAGLDPYRRWIPRRLAKAFRLEFLHPPAAREAIRRTAAHGGVEFAEDAAVRLVADLGRVRVQQPDGSIGEASGQDIEPVQLQVVCRRLWNQLPPGGERIGLDLVEQYGQVGEALGAFYAESVAQVAIASHVPERAIRAWFDGRLITKQGIRGQVLQEAGDASGLPGQAISALIDAHLVRAESRRGLVWYELAHDRLIAPILADNDAWYRRNLSALQQQARLWNHQGRAPGYLVIGDVLAQAEQWAAEHPDQMTEIDREYLEESQRQREADESTRRQQALVAAKRRNRALLAGIGVLILLVAVAFSQWREAESQRTIARSAANISRSRQLASDAGYADSSLDLLLSLEALGSAPTLEARRALLTALLDSSPLIATSQPAASQSSPVTGMAFSPVGQNLAWSDEAGRVFVWDVDSDPSRQEVNEVASSIQAVAFHPDGKRLAWGADDGAVHIWSAETGEEPTPYELDRAVTALAFDATGGRIAAASEAGEVKVWDFGRTAPDPIAQDNPDEKVLDLTFTHDGQALLLGLKSGARLVRLDGGQPRPFPTGVAVMKVASTSDFPLLALGADKDEVLLWGFGLPTPESQTFGPGHAPSATITALAIGQQSLQTRAIASADNGGNLYVTSFGGEADDESRSIPVIVDCRPVVDATAPRQPDVTSGQPGDAGCTAIDKIAFSSDGATLAVGYRDGEVALVDVSGRASLLLDQQALGGTMTPAAMAQNGETIAAIEPSGLTVWRALDGQRFEVVLREPPANFTSVATDAVGARVAVGGRAGGIVVWRTDGAPVAESMPALDDFGAVTSIAIHRDALVAAGDAKGAVVLWDLRGEGPRPMPVGAVDDPGRSVTSLVFSLDGTMLAAGGQRGTLALWDLRLTPPEAQPVAANHADKIVSLAFSPDGATLASAGNDGKIRLWDVSQNRRVATLMPLQDVTALAFAPNSQMLAAGLENGCVELWDAGSYRPLGALGGACVANGQRSVTSVVAMAFTADGNVLVAADGNGLVSRWDVNLDSWKERACRLAGRNLSRDELTSYFGAEGVPITCPQFGAWTY